jgi:polysaccharide biosynthesis protein PelG
MAGIGFSLQQLVQDDRLSSKLRGFLHATAIVAGPWLITCVILALLQSLASGLVKDAAMVRFSSLTLYAFSISLVVSGPIVMVVSRCLADAIYAKQVRGVPAMLFKSLNVVLAVLALIGLPLYGWLLDLPLADRVLGFALMMVCGGVWVVMGLCRRCAVTAP